ncbi:MAG: 6-bladed beta-propeller [Gemmatimonadota bacterium]|nr:6-bladed beta-propeller [Gemmatimonadota bacterium]
MQLRILPHLSIGVALLTGLGCAGAPAEGPDVMRTDSAGVRIVSSGAEDRELPWRFDSVGVLTDSAGEPYLFTAMTRRRVLVDRAGRTYVLTPDPAFLRFDREGRFDRTIGRRGQGPGEFEFPFTVGAQGDTLVVKDGSKRALVRFSSSLDPVADRRLEGALARAGFIEFRSGGLWFSQQLVTDSLRGIELRADTVGGAPLHRLIASPGKPVRFGCIGMPSATPIFEPTIHWAASGPRIVVNEQPDYALWMYEGGRLIAIVRRPLAPRVPTADDVRALYPDGFVIRFGGARPDCEVPADELVAKQGLAAALPLVNDVQYFSDGMIWAQRSLESGKTGVFDVFGSDGAYLGTVRGMQMPVARFPNGDLLVPREDAETGGIVLTRLRVKR